MLTFLNGNKWVIWVCCMMLSTNLAAQPHQADMSVISDNRSLLKTLQPSRSHQFNKHIAQLNEEPQNTSSVNKSASNDTNNVKNDVDTPSDSSQNDGGESAKAVENSESDVANTDPTEPASQNENSNESVAAPADEQTTSKEKVEQIKFNIREFRITGNTLLDQKELERFLYYRLGDNKTVEDVTKTAEDLTTLYKDKGFATVIVSIPEQDVTEGIVRLKVTEGKIEELRIVGSKYHSISNMRSMVPGLVEGNVLFGPEYQSQIGSLRQKQPGVAVTPLLRPGRTPGTVEMEIRVKDQLPVSAGIDVNNRYSRGTTKTRLNLSVGYDNLWQAAHSISLQHQMTPEDIDEVRATSATYLWRFRSSDDLLAIYGVNSKSDTVASLGGLSVIGKGTIFGLRYISPLESTQSYIHNFILGYDYKDFEDVLGGEEPLPVDYSLFSVQYNATIRAEQNITQFSLGANFGLGAVGNTDEEFTDKRYGSEPNFFTFRADINNTSFVDAEHSFYLRFRAQAADSPLISNEQQTVGGAETVRSYRESEALGDNAILGTVEWRYSPEPLQKISDIDLMQFYIFLDGGVAQRREPLPNEERNTELVGSGFGYRATFWKSLNMYIEGAMAFRTVGDANTPDRVEKGDARIHYQIDYSF